MLRKNRLRPGTKVFGKLSAGFSSSIAIPVAFGGIIAWQELLVMMCIQIVLKSLYEVLILPVTIRVVNAIKRIDGSDVYDEGISYKVWKISEI